MKSNTKLSEAEQKKIEEWQCPQWEGMLRVLPTGWEGLAYECKAILRARKLKGAMTLLHLVLVYAASGWSLRLVGAWGVLRGLVNVSDVALLYRFCHSREWLGKMLVGVLQKRNEYLRQEEGVHLRLIDATVISQEGSEGTDWRIHLSIDLGKMCIDGIEITDAHGGESLSRFPVREDEISIADRAYAVAKGLGSILVKEMGQLLIRASWHNLPVCSVDGERFKIIAWLKTLTTSQEREVTLTTPNGIFALRLIAFALPAEKAEQAREKLRKKAKKEGKKVNPDGLLAAGFVLLITNLPIEQWGLERVVWLYRFRWQVELQFKRLKGLLYIDHLRAQHPDLVQTFLLGKLLLALLMDELVLQAEEQHPDIFQSVQHPLSLWRVYQCFWDSLRSMLIGQISFDRILQTFSSLQRYLSDHPRKRPQQLACARSFLRLCNV